MSNVYSSRCEAVNYSVIFFQNILFPETGIPSRLRISAHDTDRRRSRVAVQHQGRADRTLARGDKNGRGTADHPLRFVNDAVTGHRGAEPGDRVDHFADAPRRAPGTVRQVRADDRRGRSSRSARRRPEDGPGPVFPEAADHAGSPDRLLRPETGFRHDRRYRVLAPGRLPRGARQRRHEPGHRRVPVQVVVPVFTAAVRAVLVGLHRDPARHAEADAVHPVRVRGRTVRDPRRFVVLPRGHRARVNALRHRQPAAHAADVERFPRAEFRPVALHSRLVTRVGASVARVQSVQRFRRFVDVPANFDVTDSEPRRQRDHDGRDE